MQMKMGTNTKETFLIKHKFLTIFFSSIEELFIFLLGMLSTNKAFPKYSRQNSKLKKKFKNARYGETTMIYNDLMQRSLVIQSMCIFPFKT